MAHVYVQTHDFNLSSEVEELRRDNHSIGAIVTFTGTVRDVGGKLTSMTLEHYPGMTEKELERIAVEAENRWSLEGCTVIHRYGELSPGDNIVLVVTASPHRQAAFEAAEFIMDFLKSEAPFWKKEDIDGNARWVDAKETDAAALRRWQQD